ncbi:MAG: hypothetical protein AAF702_40740 [Chloroflexota bacterium]
MSNENFSIEELESRHEMKWCFWRLRAYRVCRRIGWWNFCYYIWRWVRICY